MCVGRGETRPALPLAPVLLQHALLILASTLAHVSPCPRVPVNSLYLFKCISPLSPCHLAHLSPQLILSRNITTANNADTVSL